MAVRGVAELSLHHDRLLPAEPDVRAIARRIHDATRELPLISPHGHVDPRLLLDNEPFPDPATLFVTPGHYVRSCTWSDPPDTYPKVLRSCWPRGCVTCAGSAPRSTTRAPRKCCPSRLGHCLTPCDVSWAPSIPRPGRTTC
jgi:hypothetical protein